MDTHALDTSAVHPLSSDMGNETGAIQNAGDTKVVPVLLDQLGPSQDPEGGGRPASIEQYTYDFTGGFFFMSLYQILIQNFNLFMQFLLAHLCFTTLKDVRFFAINDL